MESSSRQPVQIPRPARLKLIACEVSFRELCLCAARSPNTIDLDFVRRGLHDNPEEMRRQLQAKIDETDETKDQAIALAYGLCSNGIAGLRARRLPLILPRAHDCITFFLGSKETYLRHFLEHPGTYYYTVGWLERGGDSVPRTREAGEGLNLGWQKLVEKYGEENARYLMEVAGAWVKNYTHAVFIDMGLGPDHLGRERVKQAAQGHGWEYAELTGSLDLLRRLTDGPWEAEDFLIVPPGHQILPSNDSAILTSAPQPPA